MPIITRLAPQNQLFSLNNGRKTSVINKKTTESGHSLKSLQENQVQTF